jgi:hypothetical protein
MRTLLIIIAFVALTLTVIEQTFLLRRAAVREELYRAELEQERAVAARNSIQAKALLDRATQLLEQQNSEPMKNE